MADANRGKILVNYSSREDDKTTEKVKKSNSLETLQMTLRGLCPPERAHTGAGNVSVSVERP